MAHVPRPQLKYRDTDISTSGRIMKLNIALAIVQHLYITDSVQCENKTVVVDITLCLPRCPLVSHFEYT